MAHAQFACSQTERARNATWQGYRARPDIWSAPIYSLHKIRSVDLLCFPVICRYLYNPVSMDHTRLDQTGTLPDMLLQYCYAQNSLMVIARERSRALRTVYRPLVLFTVSNIEIY